MPFDLSPPDDDDEPVDPGRRYALVVGINEYRGNIRRLETAVPDAVAVAEVLEQQHGYARVWRLTSGATAERIMAAIGEIRAEVGEDSSLLFYFAGHGLTLESEEGPRGYLIPEDATDDSASYLKMADVHEALGGLRCRHVLAILDSCFAGAFKWGSAHATRRIVPDGLMYQRTYELYLAGKARQVLVSSSYDQEALELLSGERIRGRVVEDRSGVGHSPFATALLAALRGEAGLGKGGVLTVTALSEYLRRQVEATSDAMRHRQTPQLWPLEGHDRGEYLFKLPGQVLQLADNPQLTEKNNPYRGLRSYEAEHEKMFHGRAAATAALLEKVAGQPFVVVTGESGSGKSSLMRAGLLPRLPGSGWTRLMVPDASADKKPLRPMRPGTTPLAELGRLPRAPGSKLPAEGPLGTGGLLTLMCEWRDHLTGGAEVLLPIDQFEELVTLGKEIGKDTAEQVAFQEELAAVLRSGEPRLHLLVTLRSDYAPDLAGGPLKEWWRGEALFPTPALSPVELRQIIQLPAALVALDFANPDDVDALVAEVAQTPNPLPILSCALSELYEHYVAENDGSRSLKLPEDFAQKGAVAGSLGRSGNGLRNKLPDEFHREVLDHVLLRFVSFEGGRAARRQVLKGELDYAPPADAACEVVTSRLVERRLLTTGQSDADTPCWELCHDRLLIGWGHYRRLIQEKQETIILQRRLSADMAAGERKERDRKGTGISRGSFLSRFFAGTGDEKNLWDGDPRLDQLSAELKTPLPWLNQAEREFVRYSEEAKDRQRKRRRNRTATALGIFAVAAIISIVFGFKANESATQARAAETKTRQQLALSQYREAYRMLELGNPNGAASLFLESHENDPGFLAPIDQLAYTCGNTHLLALVDYSSRADPKLLKNLDWAGPEFAKSLYFLHERLGGEIDIYGRPHLVTIRPSPSAPVFKAATSNPILKEGRFDFDVESLTAPTGASKKNEWQVNLQPVGESAVAGASYPRLYGMAAVSPDRKLLIVGGSIDPELTYRGRTEKTGSPRFYLTLLGLPDLEFRGELPIDVASRTTGRDTELNIEIQSIGWKNDSREFVIAWQDNVLNSLRIDIFKLTEEPSTDEGDILLSVHRHASSCFRGVVLPLQYYDSDPIVTVPNGGFANVISHDFGLGPALADRERQISSQKPNFTDHDHGIHANIYNWESGYLDLAQRLVPSGIRDPTSSYSARFDTGGEIVVNDTRTGTTILAFPGDYRKGASHRDPRGLAWTIDGRYLAACYYSGGLDPHTWFFEPRSGLPAFAKDIPGLCPPTANPGCYYIRGSDFAMNVPHFNKCLYSLIPQKAEGSDLSALDRFNRLINPWSVEASGALIHADKLLTSRQEIESRLRELDDLWKGSLGQPRDLKLLEVKESVPPPVLYNEDNNPPPLVTTENRFVSEVFGTLPPLTPVAGDTSWESLASEQGLPVDVLCDLNDIAYVPGSQIAAGTRVRIFEDKTIARDVARRFESFAVIHVSENTPIESIYDKFPPLRRWESISDFDESRPSSQEAIYRNYKEESMIESGTLVVPRDSSPSATPAQKAVEDALKISRSGWRVPPTRICLGLLHLPSETHVSDLLEEHSMTLERLNQLNGTTWEITTVLPAGTDVFLLP